MMKLASSAIVVAVFIMAVFMVAPPVFAQDTDTTGLVMGTDLVEKVKKGCVYIWIMTPEIPGFPGYMFAGGIGSGVIFLADETNNVAYALTNNHVGYTSCALQIETWDHQTYHGEVMALEPGIDACLVKIYNIPRESYEPCVLGDSDRITVGEVCLAVGAPGGDSSNVNRSDPWISAGLHQTTTMSVVTGRQTEPWTFMQAWSFWQRDYGQQVMTNLPWRFITQAAINPGNSGGPLFNARGECIGLNHAHFGGGYVTQNENYTIPINFCKNFAFQVLNTDKYELPWLGVDMFIPKWAYEPAQVYEFKEKYFDPQKMKVLSVRDDSPAAEAEVTSKNTKDKTPGLMAEDIIIDFDGRTFDTSYDLRLYIFGLPIGKVVPLTIRRGRSLIEFDLTIGPKRSYDSEFSV